MKYLLVLMLALLLAGCQSYFKLMQGKDLNIQRIAQETRTNIFSSVSKPIVVVKITHLNDLGNIFFQNEEYFFLNITTFNKDIYDPYFMSLSLNGTQPLWIREVKNGELDSDLVFDSRYSKGYLVAFPIVSSSEKRNIKVTLDITGYKPTTFDFGYPIIRSTI
ncbi:hypothetical protein BKH43_00215 [Helicobacter sp. 13S00401-1]|uniref:hypothetical protein n=1 Tax=Helicobacter sp. 13S00401-1 TaxID=1905758 RepID=UPI000BA65E15|nr:hypothetical protein [Helicobacter sp. 13S00401-1]PAF51701.1 hypothetical protein BKH43_00215 [Helicobacter sp. 13S00401-1]